MPLQLSLRTSVSSGLTLILINQKIKVQPIGFLKFVILITSLVSSVLLWLTFESVAGGVTMMVANGMMNFW